MTVHPLVLTAGHDSARHVLYVAEQLYRAGQQVASIVVVSETNPWRLMREARRRGLGALWAIAAARLAPTWRKLRAVLGDHEPPSSKDPLEELLCAAGISERSLRRWCRLRGVQHLRVTDLHAPVVRRRLRELGRPLVVYGGGGILRRAFLQEAAVVLNAHSGPLPEVRGMNALEWSLLLGLPPAVTIHCIDEGIDTGPVIAMHRVPLCAGDDVAWARARCAVVGATAMVDAVLSWPALGVEVQLARSSAGKHPSCSRQCFVVAPALLPLVEARLRSLP